MCIIRYYYGCTAPAASASASTPTPTPTASASESASASCWRGGRSLDFQVVVSDIKRPVVASWSGRFTQETPAIPSRSKRKTLAVISARVLASFPHMIMAPTHPIAIVDLLRTYATDMPIRIICTCRCSCGRRGLRSAAALFYIACTFVAGSCIPLRNLYIGAIGGVETPAIWSNGPGRCIDPAFIAIVHIRDTFTISITLD